MLKSCRADQIGSTRFAMIQGSLALKSHALLWSQNLILHSLKEEFSSTCYFIQLKKANKFNFSDAFKFDLIGKSSIVDDVKSYKNWLQTQ